MLIGAFAGRAKWLMWLAIPLLMVTAAVSVIPANLHISRTTTVGERHWVPTTPAEATTPHTLTIGDATLDLTSLQLAPGTTTSVKAGVGIGAILVTAPAGVHVNVTASSGLGEVAIEGMPRRNGTNVTVVGELEGAVPLGAPTIDLNVQSGVGSVEVRRA
jgi:predicted membrane protein